MEAQAELLVRREGGGHGLDGDEAVQHGVVGFVHLAHRPLPDLVEDLVFPELLQLHRLEGGGHRGSPRRREICRRSYHTGTMPPGRARYRPVRWARSKRTRARMNSRAAAAYFLPRNAASPSRKREAPSWKLSTRLVWALSAARRALAAWPCASSARARNTASSFPASSADARWSGASSRSLQ